MRFLRSIWFPVLLGMIVTLGILNSMLSSRTQSLVKPVQLPYRENEEWVSPDEQDIPSDRQGDLIRYGKDLIIATSTYLGPKGIIAPLTNGMNCQNCHLHAGTQNFGNPFSNVANNYPRYRDRSGRVESTEFRINECMQRSMNGQPLDSSSLEMRAMVAYVKWVGHLVPKGIKATGGGVGSLPILDRAADPIKGRQVYSIHCVRCHGDNGSGVLSMDSTAYIYPPLWGNKSFNVSAGIFRLSGLASFIKNNMPLGVTSASPQLTNEEAWDVAAFVSAQKRPMKFFNYDWKDIKKKPMDYPFGPYADSFTEQRHKYGPYRELMKK